PVRSWNSVLLPEEATPMIPTFTMELYSGGYTARGSGRCRVCGRGVDCAAGPEDAHAAHSDPRRRPRRAQPAPGGARPAAGPGPHRPGGVGPRAVAPARAHPGPPGRARAAPAGPRAGRRRPARPLVADDAAVTRPRPSPDLDLEFSVSGVAHRLRALGRVVREAPEVGWPYLGYGVEFLFMPPESQEVVGALVGRRLPLFPSKQQLSLGIHSTVRREEWVYEILEPVPRDTGWQAAIRRATRAGWRAGYARPFFVAEAGSPEGALRAARDFLVRYG